MNSPRPGWHRDAACRGLDPDLFFPDRGHQATEAKAICATCPVKEPCREAGENEHFGIWGGITRKERQVAQKGHTSGRLPMRGCWRCGAPTERPARYCSEWCRAEARRAVSRRAYVKRRLNEEVS